VTLLNEWLTVGGSVYWSEETGGGAEAGGRETQGTRAARWDETSWTRTHFGGLNFVCKTVYHSWNWVITGSPGTAILVELGSVACQFVRLQIVHTKYLWYIIYLCYKMINFWVGSLNQTLPSQLGSGWISGSNSGTCSQLKQVFFSCVTFLYFLRLEGGTHSDHFEATWYVQKFKSLGHWNNRWAWVTLSVCLLTEEYNLAS